MTSELEPERCHCETCEPKAAGLPKVGETVYLIWGFHSVSSGEQAKVSAVFNSHFVDDYSHQAWYLNEENPPPGKTGWRRVKTAKPSQPSDRLTEEEREAWEIVAAGEQNRWPGREPIPWNNWDRATQRDALATRDKARQIFEVKSKAEIEGLRWRLREQGIKLCAIALAVDKVRQPGETNLIDVAERIVEERDEARSKVERLTGERKQAKDALAATRIAYHAKVERLEGDNTRLRGQRDELVRTLRRCLDSGGMWW